jgi:hypothetical protein
MTAVLRNDHPMWTLEQLKVLAIGTKQTCAIADQWLFAE